MKKKFDNLLYDSNLLVQKCDSYKHRVQVVEENEKLQNLNKQLYKTIQELQKLSLQNI